MVPAITRIMSNIIKKKIPGLDLCLAFFFNLRQRFTNFHVIFEAQTLKFCEILINNVHTVFLP